MYRLGHNYGFVSGILVWISRSLNLVEPLTKMVRGNIRGTDIVLQVSWDSTNVTKKGLGVWIDHMFNSYDY